MVSPQIPKFPDEPSYFTPEHLDRLLVFCYKNGSSDISVQTGECAFAEIEGKLIRMTERSLIQQEVQDLINYIYGPNATALVSSGTDIDTSYVVKFSSKEFYRFRVNITPCAYEAGTGIQVTLRIISSVPPSLSMMDLPQKLLDVLSLPQGIFVVSGATGSGKSTLLASIIGDLVGRPESNLKVLTYDSSIEYVYDGVTKPSSLVCQTEIPRYLPSFAAGVRNALRRKPGLILVGEARDRETIEAVIDAALTGHPVYTTVHSNGVADTLRRMITIFPFAERDSRMFDLLESTKVILWQTLVPSIIGKRLALREFLHITPAVRDALLVTHPDQMIKKTRELIEEFGQSIDSDASEKYKQGLISKDIVDKFVAMRRAHVA